MALGVKSLHKRRYYVHGYRGGAPALCSGPNTPGPPGWDETQLQVDGIAAPKAAGAQASGLGLLELSLGQVDGRMLGQG